MLAHPRRSPDVAREVLLAQPVLAAVPPRGLRGGLGLALAAGLSLGGSSRALSLCGWPARCLQGVGVDALLAHHTSHRGRTFTLGVGDSSFT